MAGQSNPWAETDLLSGIKLGCPENGLVMARQFSLQRVGSTYVCTPPNHLCITAFRLVSSILLSSCMACFTHTCHAAVCATSERIGRIQLSYVQVFGRSQESL